MIDPGAAGTLVERGEAESSVRVVRGPDPARAWTIRPRAGDSSSEAQLSRTSCARGPPVHEEGTPFPYTRGPHSPAPCCLWQIGAPTERGPSSGAAQSDLIQELQLSAVSLSLPQRNRNTLPTCVLGLACALVLSLLARPLNDRKRSPLNMTQSASGSSHRRARSRETWLLFAPKSTELYHTPRTSTREWLSTRLRQS